MRMADLTDDQVVAKYLEAEKWYIHHAFNDDRNNAFGWKALMEVLIEVMDERNISVPIG